MDVYTHYLPICTLQIFLHSELSISFHFIHVKKCLDFQSWIGWFTDLKFGFCKHILFFFQYRHIFTTTFTHTTIDKIIPDDNTNDGDHTSHEVYPSNYSCPVMHFLPKSMTGCPHTMFVIKESSSHCQVVSYSHTLNAWDVFQLDNSFFIMWD